MNANALAATVSTNLPVARERLVRWAGRVLSGLATLFLSVDAGVKVLGLVSAEDATNALGWSASAIAPLGYIELACLALYLVPRTAVIGAVLWTGYLGGAVATHARIADPLFSHTLFPIYVAIFLWGGLVLRDARAAALFTAKAPRS